ncbi:RING-H2 finger protein [Nymphaea thermarum]|nr:RING-H2 finger protein [Nymphaea thermarum]
MSRVASNEVSAESRRLLKQLRSPPPPAESSPYPYTPSCSYACDTAKSLGIGLLAAGLGMVLYLLIRLISNSLSRCEQPRATGGGAAPSPKARDLSFIPTKVVCGGRETASRQDCAICLARFSDGETIRVLPRCKHDFHRECLDPWLHSRCTASSLCPVCRDPVTELWDNRQANVERPRDGGPSAMATTSILAQ